VPQWCWRLSSGDRGTRGGARMELARCLVQPSLVKSNWVGSRDVRPTWSCSLQEL
jgi:hypothetical protein